MNLKPTRREVMHWGLASALPGLSTWSCAPTLSPPQQAQGTWNNAASSIQDVTPELIAHPASASALITQVQAAESRGRRVRMAGSGHSFSDVAITDDVLLLPERLGRRLSLQRNQLKSQCTQSHLVRVEGGATIRSLNRELAHSKLAFENLGGYDAQTLVGAAMTATHGSGLAYGPITSQIVSLDLVTSGGEVLRLEPSEGITDPAGFAGRLPEEPAVRVELVQDDRVFHAVTVSMGCMGVVYAAVVRAVDSFWIREQRTLESWRKLTEPDGYLTQYLRRPRDPAFPDHVEVYVSPYSKSGDHHCVLTRRWRLSTSPKRTVESRTRGLFGQGSLFSEFAVREWSERALVNAFNEAKHAGLVVLHAGMLAALVDRNYTAASHEVFNLGAFNQFRVFGVELAFRLEQTIPAAEAMFNLAEQERQAGRHHSVPVTLRFVKASPAFLAMQHGQDTMMMEIGMLVRARGSATLLHNYQSHFVEKFSARPHWGLDLSYLQSAGQVAALYPGWNDWLSVYRRFNRNGTFDGRFTDRLGISMRPRRNDHPR